MISPENPLLLKNQIATICVHRVALLRRGRGCEKLSKLFYARSLGMKIN